MGIATRPFFSLHAQFDPPSKHRTMTLSCLRPSLPAALAPRAAASSLRAARSRRCAFAKRSPARALAACSPSASPRPGLGSRTPLSPSRSACRAARDERPPPPSTSLVDAAGSLAALALWGALLLYALNFSPNQTPARDMYFLAKLVPGSGAPDDGVAVNRVFAALFNAMGVMPALYAALLIPAGRSGGAKRGAGEGDGGGGGFPFPPRLPAFPFVVGSFALGFFALGPYLALWTPAPAAESLPEADRDGPRDATAPPNPEALEKNGAVGAVALRALESPVTAAILLLGALSQAWLAATAGPAAWNEFARLFDESRLVHVTSLDFLALSSFIPFWVSLDAGSRKWSGASFAAALGAVPLVGPALYLALRPKAEWKKKE
jgi:hypothetical protein